MLMFLGREYYKLYNSSRFSGWMMFDVPVLWRGRVVIESR